MKWGVRRKRTSAQKAQRKAEKKTQKALYKEARNDIRNVARAQRTYNKDLVNAAGQNIHAKRLSKQGYNEAFNKAGKAYKRKGRAIQVAAIASMSLSIALATKPEAVYKGASIVGSVVGNAAATAGMYAKYAAKAAVPVSRTVKDRGYIQAILVNSGNAVGFPG